MSIVAWLRILVVHPVALVGPDVVLSYLLATGKDDEAVSNVGVMLYVLALAPLAAAMLTWAMLRKRDVSRPARSRFAALSFVFGVGVAFLGFLLWLDAIEIACNGGYECPL